MVTTTAQRLLDEYAPQRPVRLLGVRVAGLTGAAHGGDRGAGDVLAPDSSTARRPADQLALPL